ncbi:hypothetical protein A2230_01485 [candidate division WOR-1 bacterium RIFOXYA2_FULL_36_21]|uniref:Outer membrane protein beta-barrel domain-containing protein n=1 Tax=candidate division WOR-1 bacterium RIFOXYB2_FULL_36_35 TaxID=1802578 RepID=A0A1F4S6D3_UNCSA|nr:MAG: hypothetical protein A2230_01485 [candidate division WOR-1 bacterium RIFOXYA2_FULL_36_21]OGC14354.1 MAG: hypothetical protein A2282_07870 [candidate division WOR-1 bacterium RIFOXYA12_FULL_36_13]OGC15970.1 MAG: hypothetical protein A2290_06955 [candidate division WOR-1 bacterium RIFOXYB2_FULL_36_35]
MKRLVALVLMLGLLMASSSFAAISGIGSLGGTPFLRLEFGSGKALDLGATYTDNTAGGAANTTLGALVRFSSVFMPVGNSVDVYWGLSANITSRNNAGVTTTPITVSGFLGAESMLSSNVGVFGDLNLINFTSTSAGGTSTSTYSLLTASTIATLGIVLYL